MTKRQRGWDFGAPVTFETIPKQHRTIYVGNLEHGMVTDQMVHALFTHILATCEGAHSVLSPPVVGVTLCGGGTYALVELRDDRLCETLLLFDGMQVSGRQLKLARPSGYKAPVVAAPSLPAPPDLLRKFQLQPAYGVVAGGSQLLAQPAATPTPTPPETGAPQNRHIHVGNLPSGVTSLMLTSLFSEPLLAIPANQGHPSPPVVNATLDESSRSGLIEFRDEPTALVALSLFNGVELLGCEMKLERRPAGDANPGGPSDAPSRGPTRNVCLGNILSSDVLSDALVFDECLEDIRAEAQQFGKIDALVVPRTKGLAGRPATDEGKVFIKYADVCSAASPPIANARHLYLCRKPAWCMSYRAAAGLRDRMFDGRLITAEFIPNEAMEIASERR